MVLFILAGRGAFSSRTAATISLNRDRPAWALGLTADLLSGHDVVRFRRLLCYERDCHHCCNLSVMLGTLCQP